MTVEQPVGDFDFETRFMEILQTSREQSSRACIAVQDLLTKDVGPRSMPEVPAWRLHLTATSTFLGVLQCLETRFSSLGALSLTRGLVEAWTHLYFIADSSERGTPALRAIQFEHGVLYEWTNVRKLMTPDLDYHEHVKGIDRSMLELYKANGHDGLMRRRTYGDVNRTLKKMAASPEFSKMDLLHAASSMAVHASASDFLLELSPTSVTVEWASPGRRCAWLKFAVVCYDYLTISAISLSSDEGRHAVIQESHDQWLAICNDPLITGAVATSDPISE